MPRGIYKRTQEFIDKYLSHCKRVGLANKGRKHSEETKRKDREGHLGLIEPHRGKPWSKERREARPPKKPFKLSGKEYDPNWSEIRKIIYRRDNWHCKECGIKTTINGSHKIACHHIDYDINNNNFNNLITLCLSCHCKTNYNREDWTNYFFKKGF